MIIEGLLTVLSGLLQLLFTPFHIPHLPESVETSLSSAFQYITDGLSFFACFCHFSFLSACFAIVVAVQAAFLVYKFILWILKKIPVAGVE